MTRESDGPSVIRRLQERLGGSSPGPAKEAPSGPRAKPSRPASTDSGAKDWQTQLLRRVAEVTDRREAAEVLRSAEMVSGLARASAAGETLVRRLNTMAEPAAVITGLAHLLPLSGALLLRLNPLDNPDVTALRPEAFQLAVQAAVDSHMATLDALTDYRCLEPEAADEAARAVDSLREAVAEADAQRQVLRRRLAELEQEKVRQRQALDQEARQLEEAQRQVAAAEQELGQLRRALDEARQRRTELEGQVQDMQDLLAELRTGVEEQRSGLAELQPVLERFQRQLSAFEGDPDLRSLSEEMRQLLARAKRLRPADALDQSFDSPRG